jgi:spore maturation protein CgeB
MRIVLFCHSLVSDWNHGNAHFLRGVVSELGRRGHDVLVYEPRDGWSITNLRADAGDAALASYREAYPGLASRFYELDRLDLDAALEGAQLVLVHEWNDPALVGRLGRHRRHASYRLLFHDTHHRSVTDPAAMARYDLADFDGVLAFGDAVRDVYQRHGWGRRTWTWHEAADTTVFRPTLAPTETDVVWIGNWGDDERTRELEEFVFEPIKRLALTATVYGVRYPESVRMALGRNGIVYRGYLPNHRVPATFGRHRVTIHVPRRPYVHALRGIPTIRVFEALACEIPLVTAPWDDCEGLFSPGSDFLVARDGDAMGRHLRSVVADPGYASALAAHGLGTVLARHTCRHRVDELLTIVGDLGLADNALRPARACAAD